MLYITRRRVVVAAGLKHTHTHIKDFLKKHISHIQHNTHIRYNYSKCEFTSTSS